MPEQMRLNATILSGIQDTEQDWDGLKGLGTDLLNIHSPARFPSARDKSREVWIQEAIRAEAMCVRASASNILIGHSFGGHRIFDVIKECDQVQAAIIITPAANTNPQQDPLPLEIDDKRKRREPTTSTESLMWNTVLDMSDDDFHLFCARHDIVRSIKRKDINAMFRFLSEGTSFRERLGAYKANVPLLIFQSRFDPWFIEGLSHPQASVIDLPEGTRHYPHVSQANFINETYRMWLKEIGILTDDVSQPIYVDEKNSSKMQEVTI